MRYAFSALIGLGLMCQAVSGMEQDKPFGQVVLNNESATIWWCENTWKIGLDQKLPEKKSNFVLVEMARNEYEPVQIVVYPREKKQAVTVTLENLPADMTAEVCREHYVPVVHPTDAFGKPGWYPDALPPMTGPVELKTKQNNPFWITFHTTPGVKSGDHKITAVFSEAGEEFARVPIKVHVFNFTLPDDTHTRTAFGLGIDEEWHGKLSREQHQAVYDKYVEVLARHRIAFMTMGPSYGEIKITFNGDKVMYDFSDFDRIAHDRLDVLKLNAFSYPYDIMPKEINGFKQGTKEYEVWYDRVQKGIVEHLKEKGWLQKAYTYWIDEPDRSRYDEVKKGMDLIRRHIPELKRLLTCNADHAPNPTFYGYVNLWVPGTDNFDYEKTQARQKLGEEVWWYVCCGPKYPYPNRFIDHPAINHRIYFWMMEKYHIQGDLYWATTYWQYKNPWYDAESHWFDLLGKDSRGSWGNGDGYLFYPPVMEKPNKPVLDGPICSIRLELIREGLEDLEYFWLLKQTLNGKDSPALHLPDKIITDPKTFDPDPQKLFDLRRQVAKAIEEATTSKAE